MYLSPIVSTNGPKDPVCKQNLLAQDPFSIQLAEVLNEDY